MGENISGLKLATIKWKAIEEKKLFDIYLENSRGLTGEELVASILHLYDSSSSSL